MKTISKELLKLLRKQRDEIEKELQESDNDYEKAYCKLADLVNEVIE